MAADPTLYAIRHPECHHVLALANTETLAWQLAYFRDSSVAWEVTTDPSDSDIEALLRGIRCHHCTFDTQEVSAP